MTIRLSTLSSTGDRGTPSNGAFYTSIVTWESAEQGNHVAGDTSTLECYVGTTQVGNWQADGSLDENLALAGWATNVDVANQVIIKAASGEEFTGDVSTGFAIGGTAHSTYAISVGMHGATFQNIICFGDWEFGTFGIAFNADCQPIHIENIYINNNGSRGDQWHASLRADSYNWSGYIRNCLIVNDGNGSAALFRGDQFAGNGYVENNTFIAKSNNVCITLDNSTSLRHGPVNCAMSSLVQAYSTNPLYNLTGSSNNAYTQGTNPDSCTNPQLNLSITDGVDYVSPSTNDYNVVAAGLLDGTGLDNSASPAGAYTTDIAGNTRGDGGWEIGAYEIQAAAGVTFDGPNIVNQTGTENQVFTFDENGEGTVASRFTGASTYALSPLSDALPAGLTVNATTGNIEGTPTEVVTRNNVIIRGTE